MDVTSLFSNADYYGVVNHETSRRLLALPWNSNGNTKADLVKIKEDVASEISRRLQQQEGGAIVVMVGGALLQLFCMANWTGPPLTPIQPITNEDCQEVCLEELSINGEIYPLTKAPMLLWLARVILVDNSKLLKTCDHWPMWSVRCLFTWQRLLGECVASLWEKISHLIAECWSDSKGWSCRCEQLLEMGHIYLYYLQYDKAKEFFLSAQQLVNMKTSFTGQLGRRTRFQQSDVAQLVLDVTIETANINVTVNDMSKHFPEDVSLKDDTVLNEIKFATPADGNTQTLNYLQLAVIIALCTHVQKTTPPHMVKSEELHAYLRVILKQRAMFCWAGLMSALIQRCRLEYNQQRRVERCMMQLEVLSKSFTDLQPEAKYRLKLFHCLPLSPHWSIQHHLANCLVSLGCSHDALVLYEKLQLWEGLIVCLKNVGRLGKAEHVIREQLKIKETPLLWCHLGDITEKESCYQKAWQLSQQHSSRAQRSLGMLYLKKGNYKDCVDSLEKSLAISGLQEGVWFTLGHAALKTSNHDLAVKAFRRCVLLDADNGEAWSNLATVHLKRNEKEKAFHCLLEAVKGCYDNWRIWENYLLVSVETGHYNEAIAAYHRLLDLKGKFCDIEVLQHLVRLATDGCYGNDLLSDPKDSLQKISMLLARITSQVTSNAEVWQLCAHVHLKGSSPNYEKAATELQRALRVVKQSTGWEKNTDQCERAVKLSLQYSQVCREYCSSVANLTSARLAMQALLAALKKNYVDTMSDHMIQQMTSLKQELDLLNQCTSQLKDS